MTNVSKDDDNHNLMKVVNVHFILIMLFNQISMKKAQKIFVLCKITGGLPLYTVEQRKTPWYRINEYFLTNLI